MNTHSASNDGPVDAITAEVINMAMQETVLEMGITVERTSGSPGATDAKDYSCVLTQDDGATIAYYGNNLQHLGDSRTGTLAIRRMYTDDQIREGDVFIYNDPFSTGALHQADVAIQTPIFYEGSLVGWTFTNIHMADIGGMSPSGFTPESRDVYSEGLRMAPVKIVDAGRPNDAVWSIIRDNVRTPIVLGDIRSAIASNNVGCRRFVEAVEEHGLDVVRRYLKVNQDLVSTLVGERIARIPVGTYSAMDWVEYDPFDEVEYIPIQCTLTVTEDHRLVFDYTGSGQQAPGYANSSEGAIVGSVMPVLLAALLPDFPVNAGVYNRFEVKLGPPGQITNPTPPAGVSGGHMEGGPRALRAAHTALVRAMRFSEDPWIRERSYALGGLTVGVIVLTGHYANGNRGYAFMLDQQSTGHGATPLGDGVAYGGIDYSIAGRQPDVESTEAGGPVLYLWRREVPDSGGAGLHRGGNSLETMFIPWGVEAAEISHACAGGVIPTLGVGGGYPGGTTFTEIYRGIVDRSSTSLPGPNDITDSHESVPSKSARREIGLADGVRQVIAAGSGWGDPINRSPELVASDVSEGAVSPEGALGAFGVVVRPDHSVDEEATLQRRIEIRRDRGATDPGAARTIPSSGPFAMTEERLSCAACDEGLGTPDTWLEKAAARTRPLAERVRSWHSPIVDAHNNEFDVTELACPRCGALLDITVNHVRSR